MTAIYNVVLRPLNHKSGFDKTESTTARVCREFTESTTLHGIKNVFKTGSSGKKRINWFGCLVVAVVFYTIFTHILVSSFFSFDVITHVTMVNQEAVDFPAVTIYNLNTFWRDCAEQNRLPPYNSSKFAKIKMVETVIDIQLFTVTFWRRLSFFTYTIKLFSINTTNLNFLNIYLIFNLIYSFMCTTICLSIFVRVYI